MGIIVDSIGELGIHNIDSILIVPRKDMFSSAADVTINFHQDDGCNGVAQFTRGHGSVSLHKVVDTCYPNLTYHNLTIELESLHQPISVVQEPEVY